MIRIFLIALLAFALSSCGFQLRGTGVQALEVESVNVVGSEPELMDELEDTLKSIGVDVSEAEDPEYVISIVGESLGRRAVATSADITVSEYEVQVIAVFTISDADGNVIIPPAEIRAERVYSFDATNFVSNNEEEASCQKS